MKKIALALSISIGIIGSGFGQSSYKSAIGGRLGTGYFDLFSASYKIFLGDSPEALEFNVGFRTYSIAYN